MVGRDALSSSTIPLRLLIAWCVDFETQGQIQEALVAEFREESGAPRSRRQYVDIEPTNLG